MSIFKRFLENSDKIDIEHTATSEDQKTHYFMNSVRKNVKSLALLAALLPMSAYATNGVNFTLNESEINQVIKDYSLDHNLPLENTKIIYYENSGGVRSLHEMGNIKTCKIIISSTGGGDFSKLLNNMPHFEQKLYDEMVLNHEMSHCIDDKQFVGSGLSPSSEKWLSDWVVGEYVTQNSLKDIFEENFADSLGALTLLKNNNFSDSAVSFLSQWEKVRRQINEDSEQNGNYFDEHNTANSLSYILKNISNVKKIDNSEMINVANTLASQAVMQAINVNRKVEKDFIIDEDGNIKPGGKKGLGLDGIALLNDIIDDRSYQTIRDISVNLIYEFNKTGVIKNRSSSAFQIAKEGFLFFNVQEWKDVSVKNSIDTLDRQLQDGSYYRNMIENNKIENKYKTFKSEILKKSLAKLKDFKIDQFLKVEPANNNSAKISETEVNDHKSEISISTNNKKRMRI